MKRFYLITTGMMGLWCCWMIYHTALKKDYLWSVVFVLCVIWEMCVVMAIADEQRSGK